MALFPSEEWLEEYVARINSSAEYADAAAAWEGDLLFVYEKEPERKVPEDVHAWLDLWHGRCRAAELLKAEDPRVTSAAFTVSASYSRWKSVLRKELDPITAMMQGKLRVKGDLPAIVRHARAANVLVDLTTQVPTEFVDEV